MNNNVVEKLFIVLPMMTSQVKISIIVTSYNQKGILSKTLKHLGQLAHPQYEIIVMDKSAEARDMAFPDWNGRVRYYHLGSNEKLSARNFGLLQAKGEIVLFCDDDIIPTQRWLQAHEENYADPLIGGVAGRIIEDSGETQAQEVGKINWRTGQLIENFNSNIRAEIDYGRACNLSLRANVLRKLSGFDTRFGSSAVLEEIDACLRVKSFGYKIIFEPQANVIHLKINKADNNYKSLRDRSYWYGHNSSLLFFKNFDHRTLLGHLTHKLKKLLHESWRHKNTGIFFYGIKGLVDGYYSYHHRDGNGYSCSAPL